MTNPVEQYLQEHNIMYERHEHRAVFTTAEADEHAQVPGLHCKNLVLRNRKKTRFFLVVMPADKRLDIKQLAKQIGEEKLSFASPEVLHEMLQVTPGSVSPFGLIHDEQQQLEVLIDNEVAAAELVGFHPNDNTVTLVLSGEQFTAFLDSLEHEYKIISS